MEAEKVYVHPTAVVEDGVELGPGTRVWHICQVRKGAKVGQNCVLARGVFIDTEVTVGDSVKIQNYVSVYHGVTIEDGVFVGPHVCFTNDKNPRAVNPDLSPKAPDDWTITRTRVKTGAALGANSTIVCGVTVGRWAVIGSGTVVTKDVPDYALVVGNPGRVVGWVCARGIRREDQRQAAESSGHAFNLD